MNEPQKSGIKTLWASYKTYPFAYWIFYCFNFFAAATLSLYLPLFFRTLNFTNTEIGLLTSVKPFVALFAQAFWGIRADKAKSRMKIVQILLIASALIVLPFPMLKGFGVFMFAMGMLSLFNSAWGPIADAIILDYMETSPFGFGSIRMAGTIGWMVSSFVSGYFVELSVTNVFYVFSFVLGISLVVSFFAPKPQRIETKQKKEKVSIALLLQNKQLMLLLALHFFMTIPLTFYSVFFQIYFTEMGASLRLVKWATFIATIAEIPFLLYGKRIIKKYKPTSLLLFASIIFALRWFLFYFVDSVALTLVLQLLHGLTYIIFSYTIAMYINQVAPPELKATGQALSAIIVTGFGSIIGSLLSGWLADLLSLRIVFLMYGFLTLIIIYGFYKLMRFLQN